MLSKSKSAMGLFGRLTRRYSWHLIIGLIAIALLLLLGAAAAVYFGFPEYQEHLVNAAQSLAGVGAALGSVQAYWKQIRRKYAVAKLQHARNHVVVCGMGAKGMRLVETFLSMETPYSVVVIDSMADHPDSSSCWERGVVVITGDASDQAILDEANTARAKFIFAVTGNDETNIEIARAARQVSAEAHAEGEPIFLRCFSHVTNACNRDIFSRHELFDRTHDGFDASLFSVYESAARFAVERFPPDLAGIENAIKTPLKVLVIGFGRMGEAMVKQVARIGHYLQWEQVDITVVDTGTTLAEERFLGIYGDGKTPPSFVVPGVSVHFIDKDPEAIGSLKELTGSETLPALVYLSLEQDSNAASLALRIRSLLARESIPIVCCMQSPLSQLMERNEFPFLKERNISSFNVLDFACAAPVLMEEVTDEMAKSIHCAYTSSLITFTDTDFTDKPASSLLETILSDLPVLKSRLPQTGSPVEILNQLLGQPDLYDLLDGKLSSLPAHLRKLFSELGNLRTKKAEELSIPQKELILRFNQSLMAFRWPQHCPDKVSDNPSLVGWRDLTEDKKDSNRWQADHLSIKLRAIGYQDGDMTSLEHAGQDFALLHRLSEMEHRRWCAALLMDGWRYGPGKKNNLRKTHPCLVTYEKLPDAEKAKDDIMIHNIRNLVTSPGWQRYQSYIAAR